MKYSIVTAFHSMLSYWIILKSTCIQAFKVGLGYQFFRIHDVQHFDLSADVVSVYCLYPQIPTLPTWALPPAASTSPAPAHINKEGEWTQRDQRTTSYAEQFLREVEMLHGGSSSGRHGGRVNWHFYNDCPPAAAAGQRSCGGGGVQISNIWPKCQRRAELQLEWCAVCTLH